MQKAPPDESKIDDAEPSVRVGFDLPDRVHAALKVAAIRERTTLRGLIIAKLSEFAELERVRGVF